MSQPFDSLLVEQRDDVYFVTLTRPDVRNAFNAQLISELYETFAELIPASDARSVVLCGTGKVFCAGADLKWMRASAGLGKTENQADATRMSQMFQAIEQAPIPVIARCHGAALGGGAGLIAAADITIIAADAKVGFTEVRLGIIPAVISPFALAKIGATHARRYFLTGEVFDGVEAARIGLAQKVVAPDDLDSEVGKLTDAISQSGPAAVQAAKRLVRDLPLTDLPDVHNMTASRIADIRTSDEAQDGMAAFLDGKSAPWRAPENN